MTEQNGFLQPSNPGHGLISAQEWPRIASVLKLTDRESQVIKSLLLGKTRSAIAKELDVRDRTVRQFVQNIHDKLEVENRVGMALRVICVRDQLRERDS